MLKHPLIAVTMGDPAGVGPELCVRLLAEAELAAHCTPVVFGDYAVLERAAKAIDVPLRAPAISREAWPSERRELTAPAVFDLRAIEASAVVPGVIGAHTGAASFAYIDAA